jgi:hypothetical protein
MRNFILCFFLLFVFSREVFGIEFCGIAYGLQQITVEGERRYAFFLDDAADADFDCDDEDIEELLAMQPGDPSGATSIVVMDNANRTMSWVGASSIIKLDPYSWNYEEDDEGNYLIMDISRDEYDFYAPTSRGIWASEALSR